MPQIKCPNCNQVFTVDEASYGSIVQQIRNHEFEEDLNKRIQQQREALERDYRQQLQLNMKDAEQKKADEINSLTLEIQRLKAENEQKDSKSNLDIQKAVAEKDSHIAKLTEQLESIEKSMKLSAESELSKAVSVKNEEISRLNLEIQRLKSETQQIKSEQEINMQKAVSEKDNAIIRLEAELSKQQTENELAVKNAVMDIQKEKDIQKAGYELEIRQLRENIEYYKDMKTKMSTKMIGESLEQHCLYEFNRLRGFLSANVQFGKDNEVSDTGSKGDFIYREFDDDGTEIISIMFEMKNEMETTKTKHRNEDFFKELDKDRKEKRCEYAVLVSLLETDNDLYNNGIVDVSYMYQKMYVIRPQFFIPMITVLRNSALNSMEYKRQLTEIRNQEIDITNFEDRITAFKTDFSRNYELASKQFHTAIDEIDKTIDHLNKVKESLLKSEKNLRIANEKSQKQLTIKALTKDNDTMIQKFAELSENDLSD